jgi:hypothetical protein
VVGILERVGEHTAQRQQEKPAEKVGDPH